LLDQGALDLCALLLLGVIMAKRKGWWNQLQSGDYPETQLDYGDVTAVSYRPGETIPEPSTKTKVSPRSADLAKKTENKKSSTAAINSEIIKTHGECPTCGLFYRIDNPHCTNCGWSDNPLKKIPIPPYSPISKPSNKQEDVKNLERNSYTKVKSTKKILKKVTIYTDGACLGNPGPGGYGAVLIYGSHRKEISGGYRLTTNNRMEIMAVITALSALKSRCQVDIYSDSQYVVNAMTKGWVKRWKAKNWMRTREEKAKNPDLWEKLLQLCERHQVSFHWIKGHNNHAENDRCDQLAVAAAATEGLPADVGYEVGLKTISL
jgi:ribonuclease HI